MSMQPLDCVAAEETVKIYSMCNITAGGRNSRGCTLATSLFNLIYILQLSLKSRLRIWCRLRAVTSR